MDAVTRFLSIMKANRAGRHRGVFVPCTANWASIEAALRQSVSDDSLACIDFTCNQVNQDGGYTNMRPADFTRKVLEIAARLNLPADRVLLGGDHLGPMPWQHLPAAQALEKAGELIRAAVLAGVRKIHIDPSMVCADDAPGQPLHVWGGIVAERTARLARIAEDAWVEGGSVFPRCIYGSGTEVPPAGGERDPAASTHVSSVEDAEFVWASMREAFYRYDLQSAWDRLVAIVVEPGIAEGAERNRILRPEAILGLTNWIRSKNSIVFEAHSTDGNPRWALQDLVLGGFAILKVGPALTRAYRQTLEGMCRLEEFAIASDERSNLFAILEKAMLANPKHWLKYYGGEDVLEAKQAELRRHSFLDRCRYYWTVPEVVDALGRLFENMRIGKFPEYLIGDCLPLQARLIAEGVIQWTPEDCIQAGIRSVTKEYSRACGHSGAINGDRL